MPGYGLLVSTGQFCFFFFVLFVQLKIAVEKLFKHH